MSVTFVQWIDRQPWFHALVRGLRVRSIVSWVLRVQPWVRAFPSSGTHIVVADLESFYLSDEIFKRETYRRALELAGEVKTVIDLGCNVGFFCCYLRHFYGRNNFVGLGIDANISVLERADYNLEINSLQGIELLNGLVGGVEDVSHQSFYVYASHLGSSQFIQTESGRIPKGDWKKVDVPVIWPGEIWRDSYGDRTIDLLKIDIEGSEGALLRNEPVLFWQTKCIVLEWHKWLVKEEELFPVLRDLGFTYQEALEKGPTTELWFFSRED